jgi:hypothetical protein
MYRDQHINFSSNYTISMKLEDLLVPGLIILFILLYLKKQTTAVVAPVAGGGIGGDNVLAARLWTAIGDPSPIRFTKRGMVSVTGTVVGKEPHYNTDGDLVFGLKPDPQFQNLLTPQNKTYTIAGGGLWCEAVCQRPNTSIEPVHFNDCKRGGPFPIFPMPKMGERWRVTGLHIIDIREGGHAEIHPITSMSKL